ncbi:unnamed protein product [Somion occarium]|uniref:NmrA-like domain-containing protein n=1 Tax=Somion occarium TaxID=3059160 RepID=A0ABP1D4L6_9APHY
MSSSKIPIFILGATGYIGGSVLTRLLAHPNSQTFDITALVRSAEKAQRLQAFGINAVTGSTDEKEKLEALVLQAHVVLSMASADNFPAIQTVLSGMKKRHDALGDVPILIHTSGTGILHDDARGAYASETIYDDMKPEQIEALPATQLHHNLDLAIEEADKAGYLRSYIVFPGTIYGVASGPFVEAGIQHPFSVQIPGLTLAALDRGQPGMVGKGLAIWPHISLDDVVDLYILLFDAVLTNPENVGHGREGYFFVENGEFRWYDLSKAIGEALVEAGLAKSSEPTSFSDEELIKYAGSMEMGNGMGTNARCRANRARALGWKPTKRTEDLFDSIKPGVEALMKAMQVK